MESEDIKYIVVHCSATNEKQDIDVEDIRKWHTSPPRNWKDVGYHFVIKRDGTVQNGRDVKTQGAHVKGYNNCSIGICLIGGIDSKTNQPDFNFKFEQIKSLKQVVDGLLKYAPHAKIQGHRDFPNVEKACPCFNAISMFS